MARTSQSIASPPLTPRFVTIPLVSSEFSGAAPQRWEQCSPGRSSRSFKQNSDSLASTSWGLQCMCSLPGGRSSFSMSRPRGGKGAVALIFSLFWAPGIIFSCYSTDQSFFSVQASTTTGWANAYLPESISIDRISLMLLKTIYSLHSRLSQVFTIYLFIIGLPACYPSMHIAQVWGTMRGGEEEMSARVKVEREGEQWWERFDKSKSQGARAQQLSPSGEGRWKGQVNGICDTGDS